VETGSRVAAGITKGAVFISSGQSDLCEPPVDPYDTNLDRHRNWIQGATGAGGMVATTGAIPHTQKSCSPLAQLSELAPSGDAFGDCDGSPWNGPEPPRTCGFTGLLDLLGLQSTMHSFPVPPGTTRLRIAFNGIALPSLGVETDYYVRASSPATTSEYDCAATASGTLGYCEFVDPTADTWYTLVDQTLYRGEYQVTITLFGPEEPAPPAVPGLGRLWRMLFIGSMMILIPAALQLRTRSRTPGH
jgi:hypothetical protein